jgi:hypothetical protein
MSVRTLLSFIIYQRTPHAISRTPVVSLGELPSVRYMRLRMVASACCDNFRLCVHCKKPCLGSRPGTQTHVGTEARF